MRSIFSSGWERKHTFRTENGWFADRVTYFYVILVIVFLVAFPKGGIKVNSIPITWGYVLLFLPFPLYLVSVIRNKFLPTRLLAYLLTLPFSIWSILILSFSDTGYLIAEWYIAFVVNLLLMPFLLLIVLGNTFDKVWFQNLFLKTFKICVRFVVLFGLVHFFYKLYTGVYLEIAYLTVNADDYGMTHLKNNLRGSLLSKLLSTYNNGNVLGICLLILTPLYLKIEKTKLWWLLLGITLLLTFSRTVWVGSLFLLFLFLIKLMKKNPGKIFLLLLCVPFFFFLFPATVEWADLSPDFLFDKSLGGRDSQLSALTHLSLAGDMKPHGIIREIVYLSIIENFGIIGFLLFLLYLLSPLITCNYFKIHSSLQMSIVVYAVLCMMDGAMLLIPTMCFFWFISSLVLSCARENENLFK